MYCFEAFGRWLKIVSVAIVLTLLLLTLSPLRAIAASPVDEATWWLNLYKSNNGKSFCIPPDKTFNDLVGAVNNYIRSNNLPDSFNEPRAVQILAVIYPCSGVKNSSANERAKLKNIIADPRFQQAVLSSAKQAAVVINNPCPSAEFSLVDKVVIYQPLTFDGSGVITAGEWKQVIQEQGCGTSRILNVIAVVKGPKYLSTGAILPGTTHADPLLQKDGFQYALRAAVGVEKNCNIGYVADTEFLGYEGTPLEGSKGQPWSELWTVNSCTKKVQVPMHFIPDRTGTSIVTRMTETKIYPIEPQK